MEDVIPCWRASNLGKVVLNSKSQVVVKRNLMYSLHTMDFKSSSILPGLHCKIVKIVQCWIYIVGVWFLICPLFWASQFKMISLCRNSLMTTWRRLMSYTSRKRRYVPSGLNSFWVSELLLKHSRLYW